MAYFVSVSLATHVYGKEDIPDKTLASSTTVPDQSLIPSLIVTTPITKTTGVTEPVSFLPSRKSVLTLKLRNTTLAKTLPTVPIFLVLNGSSQRSQNNTLATKLTTLMQHNRRSTFKRSITVSTKIPQQSSSETSLETSSRPSLTDSILHTVKIRNTSPKTSTANIITPNLTTGSKQNPMKSPSAKQATPVSANLTQNNSFFTLVAKGLTRSTGNNSFTRTFSTDSTTNYLARSNTSTVFTTPFSLLSKHIHTKYSSSLSRLTTYANRNIVNATAIDLTRTAKNSYIATSTFVESTQRQISTAMATPISASGTPSTNSVASSAITKGFQIVHIPTTGSIRSPSLSNSNSTTVTVGAKQIQNTTRTPKIVQSSTLTQSLLTTRIIMSVQNKSTVSKEYLSKESTAERGSEQVKSALRHLSRRGTPVASTNSPSSAEKFALGFGISLIVIAAFIFVFFWIRRRYVF